MRLNLWISFVNIDEIRAGVNLAGICMGYERRCLLALVLTFPKIPIEGRNVNVERSLN